MSTPDAIGRIVSLRRHKGAVGVSSGNATIYALVRSRGRAAHYSPDEILTCTGKGGCQSGAKVHLLLLQRFKGVVVNAPGPQASWRSLERASRRQCQRWWQGSRLRRGRSWRQGLTAHLELLRILRDLEERGNTKGWMVGCMMQGLCVHRSARKRRRRRTALTSG
jgi:hypothetical protein